MLLTKEVKMKWNFRNKKIYIDKGYIFTKFGDEFDVNIEDLSSGSNCVIELKCDYCGKIFTMKYCDYTRRLKDSKYKHCCKDCKYNKIHDVVQDKYGTNCTLTIDEFKEKSIKTLLNNYGVENPFESEIIKKKIKETNLQKYGCEHVMQNKFIRDKAIKTNIDKYGVDCLLRKSNIREKGYASIHNIKTSKPQLRLFELLKNNGFDVELNYKLDMYFLDILLKKDNIMIDIEYDGQYYHKNKIHSDNKRNGYCFSKDIKVLRIKGNYEIPDIKKIKKSIEKLLNSNLKYDEIFTDWKW